MIGDSSDETNFPLKLLLANRRVSRPRKAFVNNLSANINLLKTQLFNIAQSGRFVGRLLWSTNGPLKRVGLPLMKNVLQPLAKSVLMQLVLTAAATNAAIQSKIH